MDLLIDALAVLVVFFLWRISSSLMSTRDLLRVVSLELDEIRYQAVKSVTLQQEHLGLKPTEVIDLTETKDGWQTFKGVGY